MNLGEIDTKLILNSPESVDVEILNVSEITWEGGSKAEDISTSTTSGLFQERTRSDLFHRTGERDNIDAVVFLDPNESIDTNDKIKKSVSNVTFEINDIETESGYKRVELSEVI